jgi:hypothetical protein
VSAAPVGGQLDLFAESEAADEQRRFNGAPTLFDTAQQGYFARLSAFTVCKTITTTSTPIGAPTPGTPKSVRPALAASSPLARADPPSWLRICSYSGGSPRARRTVLIESWTTRPIGRAALTPERWPSDAERRSLRTEYDSARLMAGSQHPGLMGIEEAAQLLTYQTDFVLCRRIETLLCWEDGSSADIAYAARAARVIVPLTAAV